MNRNKAFHWSIALFLGLGGLLLWFLWGNRGILIVRDMPGSFFLSISEYGQFECAAAECRYHVPFGKRLLCADSPGYRQLCETVVIPWQKEFFWSPALERLPHIRTISGSSAEQKAPDPAIPSSSYLLTSDGQLLKKIGEKEEVITIFHGVDNAEIIPFSASVLVRLGGDIFLVDPTIKSKKRIYSGTAPKIRTLSDELFLVEDLEQLRIFDGGQLMVLPFIVPAEQVVSCQPGSVYFLEAGEDTEYRFTAFDLSTKKVTPITTARIEDSNGITLSCHSEDVKAVVISFPDHDSQMLLF